MTWRRLHEIDILSLGILVPEHRHHPARNEEEGGGRHALHRGCHACNVLASFSEERYQAYRTRDRYQKGYYRSCDTEKWRCLQPTKPQGFDLNWTSVPYEAECPSD